MALRHAQPGETIDIRPLGAAVGSSQTTTLVKTSTLEVIRLVLPAGKKIPEHRAAGEITVQCLEGEVDFTAGGKSLVTVDHRDAVVRFWDVASGKTERSFRAGEKGEQHQVCGVVPLHLETLLATPALRSG